MVIALRSRPPPPPTEARLLYEKGVEALHQGLPEPNAQAIGFLREAVAEAPGYADAWGALGQACYASLIFTAPDRQAGVAAQAQAAAHRALELDPDNRRGAAALALLAPVYQGWSTTEPLLLRAIRLYPEEPTLQLAYGRLLVCVGRMRESVAASQRAVDGDPFAPMNRYALAQAQWGSGRTEEADQTLRKALDRWPRHYALWFLRFNILTHTGRADQALALSEDQDRRPVSVPLADIELSRLAARAILSRAPADIAAAVDGHRAAARRGSGYAENAIDWMTAFGRTDEAFRIARALFFDEGFVIGRQRFSPDQGRFQLAGARNTYRLFTPPTARLRADPRFGVLMRDLGIARYWKTSGHLPDDPTWAR